MPQKQRPKITAIGCFPTLVKDAVLHYALSLDGPDVLFSDVDLV